MTVGKGGRPRAAHLGPDRRREQVLDAASVIAADRGMAGVSMMAVADRLGVSKPVVYACFPARDQLVDALVKREESKLMAAVLASMPENPTFDNSEQLLIEGFQALLTAAAANPERWRVVLAADIDSRAGQRIGHGRTVIRRRLGEILRGGFERWHVVDIDKKLPLLVELFFAAGEGAVRMLIDQPGVWTPQDLGEFTGRTLFNTFRKV
ncbi:TetR/AcrR family transcriptional regulator [Antrihabitans stalagmiti]|uniref:TetR/AcrR family transcriptional regulator n=1 Tax=Antrihabitans stalagmiti TaxID=2799499 RepID=UPI0027DCD72F|nr:TetR/AcrR family transcriptional regulator [Antrihabitans stalagmiti]